NADVYKVCDGAAPGCLDRLGGRLEIDIEELLRLARRGVRNPDQLNEGVARRNRFHERQTIEWIADEDFAADRRLRFRAGTDQCAHAVTARKQLGDQPPPDVAGPTSDEGVSRHDSSLHTMRRKKRIARGASVGEPAASLTLCASLIGPSER